MTTTYTELSKQTSLELITLIHLHSKKRAILFTDETSDVWSRIPAQFVVGVQIDGTVFDTASDASVSSGEFFYDIPNNKLYIHSTSDPSTREVILTHRFFYSDTPIKASWNLEDDGDLVPYINRVKSIPGFKTNLGFTNNNQSVIGTGNLQLDNSDRSLTNLLISHRFENKGLQVYAWHKDLDFSEAITIYDGLINQANVQVPIITFTIKDTVFSFKQ